ncbi:MAG: ECF transporter S component [Candidatus Cloacimonas sp.]
MKWYIIVGLTVMVMVATLLVRIPVPGGGYFNLGDVVIIFSGLFAGWKTGLIAGGIGSALADLIGFPVFAPITLIVKGLEGLVAGLAKPGRKWQQNLYPAFAVLIMIVGYFVGCWLFPNLGLAVAITDLPVNLVQAAAGYFGGKALFIAYTKISHS